MRVVVIAPERAVFDDEADAVKVPAYDGYVGILPRHAPFLALLGDGRLIVRAAGATTAFHVQGGFVQVVEDTVRVVAERAVAE
jgi:F-type H+-transporting ATPase subunit epsilon